MICALYTLKKEYLNKKIYVWNVNRDSMGVFMRAAIRRIDIQGFVSMEEQYIDKTYMNRPIVSLAQIEQDDDSVILIGDDVPVDTMKNIVDNKVIYWTKAQEINSDLYHEKVIVYGMGKGSEELCDILAKKDIKVDLYCVSKRNGIRYNKGKKVIEPHELALYENCNIVVSVLNPQFQIEIMQTLAQYHRNIFLDLEYIMDKPEELLDFIQSIHLAVIQHREIYLYGKKNMIAELIEEMLNIYEIRINGYVYDTEDKEQSILSIEGFREIKQRKDSKGILFIINEVIPERLICARGNVEKEGFSLENKDYTSMKWYIHDERWLLSEIRWYDDPLVGKTTLFCRNKLGWKQYGNSGIRIMVLGNSTSSETVHSENWISKLYSKFQSDNIEVTIYNEATICDDIVSSILRLLRDGHALHPQIVICMSGVNNTFYKECSNQFNEEKLIWGMKYKEFYSGAHCDESLYSFWNRNMQLLKRIAEFYDSHFYGFLQPMNITMTDMDLYEKSLYESERHIVGAKSFEEYANDDSGYINLMRLFEHKNEMFLDICHYTDQAQEQIANKVYEAIIQKVCEVEKGNNM